MSRIHFPVAGAFLVASLIFFRPANAQGEQCAGAYARVRKALHAVARILIPPFLDKDRFRKKNLESFDPKNNSLILDYGALTVEQKILAGRDAGSLSDLSEFGYRTKPDHAYRVVDRSAIDSLKKHGKLIGADASLKENQGVDYYSGKAALKYGRPRPGSTYSPVDARGKLRVNPLADLNAVYIIEVPVDRGRFLNLGNMISGEPNVYHLKGYGRTNPHTVDEVRVLRLNPTTNRIELVNMTDYREGEREFSESSQR